jgi:hypothetical protein
MGAQNPPNMPTTPEEMDGQAQMIAQELIALPESQKDSELIKLKQSDAIMHSLVSKHMEQIRNEAKTVGGAQVLAEQYGKVAKVRRRSIITGSVLGGRPPRYLDFE